MGVPTQDARAALRLSLGRWTAPATIDVAAPQIADVAHRITD
jgi:cysteine sulfinate desulfinase/cysteine desulfurase-like protein